MPSRNVASCPGDRYSEACPRQAFTAYHLNGFDMSRWLALFHSHETSHSGAWKKAGSLPVSSPLSALRSIATDSTTQNVLPLPGLLSTSIRPPCCSTMHCER